VAELEAGIGESSDRVSELPLDGFHLIVEEAVGKLNGHVRNGFRSAYRHLKRSWSLRPLDAEMSLFRAITAEEEAATSLILALRQRGYDGAEKLNPRNHVHKAGVTPFLDAVNEMLADSKVPVPKLNLQTGERPRIDLVFDLATLLNEPEPRYAYVDEPFNYVVRREGDDIGYMFERELQDIASGRGSKSIAQFIKDEANLRNRLLYASHDGMPHVEFAASVILRRRDRVHRLALITIGIMQTRQKQLFAAQCVRAYCSALGHTILDRTDYSVLNEGDGFTTSILQRADGDYVETWTYRQTISVNIGYRWLERWHVPAGSLFSFACHGREEGERGSTEAS